MNHAVSRTAEAAAVARATESIRPKADRLFEDTYARLLVSTAWRAILRLLHVPVLGPVLLALGDRRFPGVLGNFLCRTRYIDEVLETALADGFAQVVILGAGLDSRAYRIPGMKGARVLEVDRPEMVAWKQARLRQILGQPPGQVTFVPLDFNQQTLGSALQWAGFLANVRTFFIWEGVTQYVTAEAVDATLRCVAGAASGSRIVFTYIDQGVIDGSARSLADERLLTYLRRLGAPWIFGLVPARLCDYLATRGLRLIEEVGAAEYRARYLKTRRRALSLYRKEWAVLAEVAPARPQPRCP
jgi:methyltransferase (TIGR00027 family)